MTLLSRVRRALRLHDPDECAAGLMAYGMVAALDRPAVGMRRCRCACRSCARGEHRE